MKAWKLGHWLVLAIALRAVSAYTHSTPAYLDEWYQTAEFGNWLAHGFMSYTQEFGLHLRNLSWPWVLSLALRAAQAIDPTGLHLRVFLVQFFAGIADLGIFWGVWQMCEARKLSATARQCAMGGLLLLPFMVADSVRPSAEHISVAAFFVCLGWIARGRLGLAGIAGAAVASAKFTSGLLTFGAFVALLTRAHERRQYRPLGIFLLGVVGGLFIFALPDWFVYGRPWESLWMFLQYNLFSGLSSLKFGDQSARIYLSFLWNHWGKVLTPLSLLLLTGLPRGVARAWRERDPWLFAAVFHLAPHLIIPHKEPRFVAPIELLLAWGGFLGLCERGFVLRWRGLARVYGIVLVGACLRALWGETWTTAQTWFELPQLLRDRPATCAIITVKPPRSTYMTWSDPARVPDPPTAMFQMTDRPTFDEELVSGRLVWVESRPACGPEGRVLLHLDRAYLEVERRGCLFIWGGAIARLPIAREQVRGPWYDCPASILSAWPKQDLRHIIARQMQRYETLPPIGIRGMDLFELGRKHSGDPVPDDEAL